MTDPACAHLGAASLRFTGVGHHYGRVRALEGISLDVLPGEIVCLLGRSGCGKTTLLKVSAGIERPTEGQVFLDRREVAGPSLFVPPELRGIGMIFQDYALFPHLTILDNVMFGLGRTPAAKAREVALRLMEKVGIANHAADYPHQLSGGEQQRVALARALAPRPGILLMDEPFSNLDQRLRRGIREGTAALIREQDATAIIVTHDPEEAMHIADRIVLMQAGRIMQQGTPEELYREPKSLFAARFFSDLSEIDAVCRNGEVKTPLGTFRAPAVPDGPCVVCVRPGAFSLAGGEDGVKACIGTCRFLGEVYQAQLWVEGLDKPLQARFSSRLLVVRGRKVSLVIDDRDVFVFPKG